MSEPLDVVLRPFESAFRRRDQVHWFRLYVRGLLSDVPRKNIEGIVRSPALDQTASRDQSQALQNFLNQSPWDERLLWRQLRAAAMRQSDRWLGVIEEVGIVKQGQHSVGVHRQYAGDQQRKQNCQVAIVLLGVLGDHVTPLGCRLYLPRNWTNDPERLDAGGVPAEYRTAMSRAQVGLSLLDEARNDGVAFPTVATTSRHGSVDEWRDGLSSRAIKYVVRVSDEAPVVDGVPLLDEVLDGHARAQAGLRDLKERFGLDHFEGRSWRGFHHHAALVSLAATCRSAGVSRAHSG